MNFGLNRREALKRWLNGTNRTRKGLTDYFHDSFECKKLDDLIDCVIYAYQQVDKLFDDDPKAFNKICTKFSKEPITV